MSAPEPKKTPGGRKLGSKALTTSQKAEAVALWRAGDITLEGLSKKFGKRPETFSRLFKRMGIEKGSAAAAVAEKMAAAVETRILNDQAETLKRIAETKQEHYQFSRGLARMAWSELVRAKKAELDIGTLKDVMATLKLAGDVIANSRKELYSVLNVEEAEKDKELDELPELTVRELTQDEIVRMANSSVDDLAVEVGGEGPEDDLEAL